MFKFPIKEVKLGKAREMLRNIILNKGLKWAEGVNRVGDRNKWVFDLREVIATPEGSRISALLLHNKLKNFEFDYVGGPAFAAEPIVSSLVIHSHLIGQPVECFIVRNQPNNYGLHKQVEGPIISGKKVLLVDDSINSGDSVFKAIVALNSLNFKVVGLIVLVDFYKTGHKKLLESNIKVESIFNLDDFGLNSERFITYKNMNFNNVNDWIIDKDYMPVIPKKSGNYEEFGNKIFGIDNEGYIFCLDSFSKSNIWKTKVGTEVTTPLAFDDYSDLVIVGLYSGLRKGFLGFFDADNGRIVNKITAGGAIRTKPCLFSDFLFVGSDDKIFYCVNRRTQEVLWRYETRGAIRGDISIDKILRRVYFSSSDGFVHCLNISGKLVWKKHIGNNIVGGPEIHMFSIFAASDLNVLFRLDKSNGNLSWFFAPKNNIKEFRLHRDKVIVWCDNGFLYFLSYRTGKTEHAIKYNGKIEEAAEKMGLGNEV